MVNYYKYDNNKDISNFAKVYRSFDMSTLLSNITHCMLYNYVVTLVSAKYLFTNKHFSEIPL